MIGTRFKSPKYETNMQPNQRYQWVFGNITFRNVDIVTVKRQTTKIAQKILFFWWDVIGASKKKMFTDEFLNA